MNPLLIYSHSYSSSQCFLQSAALPEGPQPHVVTQSIKRRGLSIVSLPPPVPASHQRQPLRRHTTYPYHTSSHTHPPLNFCFLPYSILSPPSPHTYPLTLNFAVKSLRATRAQRQMFPVEMRIDFPSGLRNQRFVHFHFDKKWRGASLR